MSHGNAFEALSRELKEWRLDKRIIQSKVGRALGMMQQTVSTHESAPEKIIGKGPEFTAKFLQQYKLPEYRIAKILDEFFPNAAELFKATRETMPTCPFRKINIYPTGTGPAWGDDEVLEELIITDLDGTDYVGLRAIGSSMSPYLELGDVAIVKCEDGTLNPGDYIAVCFSDGGCVVKRFVTEISETIVLESLNPDPGEDCVFSAPPGSRVIGKVVRRIVEG